MGHPVNWFEIQGSDAKSLQSFYKKVFAWKMQPAPDGIPYAMVSQETGGISGGVGASQDGSKSVTVYVGVDNIKGHLKKIEKAGGHTVMQPMDLPQGMGIIATFSDPAGNKVGLWQAGKAAAQTNGGGNGKAVKARAKAAPKAAPKAKAAAKGKAKPAKRAGKAKRR